MGKYSDIINMERPTSSHPKMDLDHRAMLFASFDALRGFDLALLTKRMEQELTPRILLWNDAKELLDRKLHMVQLRKKVTVTYFHLERIIGDLEVGTYKTETGLVEEIDRHTGSLFLDHTCIPISEIIEIESETFNMEPTSEWEGYFYGEPSQT